MPDALGPLETEEWIERGLRITLDRLTESGEMRPEVRVLYLFMAGMAWGGDNPTMTRLFLAEVEERLRAMGRINP